MANDAKAEAKGTEQDAAPKKKKLLIIILASVLVLALSAGVAVILWLNHESTDEDETGAVETAKVKHKDPIFVSMEPFTVNLASETGGQYLQVALSIEFQDPRGEQLAKSHMPKIRNNATLLLSSKKPSELLSKEGKQKLATDLKGSVNEVLKAAWENLEDHPPGEGPAKEVLFTSFIIQ